HLRPVAEPRRHGHAVVGRVGEVDVEQALRVHVEREVHRAPVPVGPLDRVLDHRTAPLLRRTARRPTGPGGSMSVSLSAPGGAGTWGDRSVAPSPRAREPPCAAVAALRRGASPTSRTRPRAREGTRAPVAGRRRQGPAPARRGPPVAGPVAPLAALPALDYSRFPWWPGRPPRGARPPWARARRRRPPEPWSSGLGPDGSPSLASPSAIPARPPSTRSTSRSAAASSSRSWARAAPGRPRP